jgi:hypothetical protein
MTKIVLPKILKVDPHVIAQDLVSVQPMTGPVGQIFTVKPKFKTGFTVVTQQEREQEYSMDHVPEGYVVVDVIFAVARWIESQPIDTWKPSDVNQRDWYIISEELLTLLALTWT